MVNNKVKIFNETYKVIVEICL